MIGHTFILLRCYLLNHAQSRIGCYNCVGLRTCISIVVDRDLLKDTRMYRWRQIHVRSRQLFSFFHAPKILQKPSEFSLYETNRLHFSVCVCSIIDHIRRHSDVFVLYTLYKM